MAKERICIVEDDEDILQLLTFNLDSAGYETISQMDGAEGLETIRKELPDLVLLDVMLPNMSGFDVCKELKRGQDTADIPVVLLTARGDEVDRVVGLELGAEDYVVKPFSPRELLLRIRTILKRAKPSAQDEAASIWRADGLVVDEEAHTVHVDGEEVLLTATEFRLLVELIRRRGRVQSRDQLLNTVWGYEFEGYARTVDTHIRRLRQKLDGYADLVETVRGVGYRFRA